MRKNCGLLCLALTFLIFFDAFIPLCALAANGNGNGNGTAEAPAQDEKSLLELARAMRRSGTAQFNFTDVELVQFVRFMAELLQRNIVIPSAVTGKISVISPQPFNLHEARQIFLSILQVNGWSLQDMGSYDKLVQGGTPVKSEVDKGRGGPGEGEEIVTHIATLDYVAADFIVQSLQQAFAQTVAVIPAGSSGRDVLLQGKATDVSRASAVIRRLDVPVNGTVNKVFPLQNADPRLVSDQLNAIAQGGPHLRGLSAVPDPNSRQIVVVAPPRIMSAAAKIIAELDIDARDANFHIYQLKNVDATEASEQLSKVLAAAAAMQPNQENKVPATVVPDLTTNSLIFAATQRQYDDLKKILDTIDVQPKQVLIRGFMAEVNVSNLDKAGIDWSIMGGQIWDNFMLGGMGQLGEGTVPQQFNQWFSDLSKQEELVERNGSTYSVTNYRPLALVYTTVEMLKKYDAVNVLSVPRLMCTDNKESSFQVGQVIPVLKGTASDISNPGAMQQNYDYKDTGLILTVTPHIRSGNVVALDIEQTTEDVLTATGALTPVTAKRQIKTSVVVEDGETIILGGIIKETDKNLTRRVPGFSAIPLIGNLFRKTSKEREKVDFIVFLTPQIIRDTPQMRRATNQAITNMSDLSDVSEVETDVDRRFRELYQESMRNK